ncbi:MAG: hypothetical protein ABEJ07_00860 [Candidatus Nanohaloarchaea archaeon]
MTAMPYFLARSVIAISALMLIGGASAASLNIEDGDTVIWNNSDSASELTLDWSSDTGLEKVTIRHESGKARNVTMDSYDVTRGMEALGEYEVYGWYSNGNMTNRTNSDSFFFAGIRPEILNPDDHDIGYRNHFMGDESKGELFKGEPVRLNLNVKGLDGIESVTDYEGMESLVYQKSNFDLPLVIPSYSNRPLDAAPFEWEDPSAPKEPNILLHPYVPADITGGNKEITTTVEYSGPYGGFSEKVSTDEEALYVTGVRTLGKQPEEDITESQIGEISLRIYVESKHRKLISEGMFEARLEGKNGETVGRNEANVDFSLTDVSGEKGVYRLELEKLPDKKPDSAEFDFEILYEDPLYSGQQPVEIASYNVFSDFVRFRGYVWDSQKQPVGSSFTVDGRSFSTNGNGFFQQKFVPGEYDFNISFKKGGKTASVNLHDVEMQSQYKPGKTKIRYEYVNNPSGVRVPGVKPMDLVSFVFRKPFEQTGSTVTIDYSVSGSDPTEVSVFSCDNWAISDSRCLSSWKKVEKTSFSPGGGWSVRAPAETFEANYNGRQKEIMRSAYVIGTRSGLRLNSNLRLEGTTGGRIVAGSELSVSGQILAAGGKQVSGVDVQVAMKDGGETVKTLTGKTDDSGSFTVSGDVPEEPGNFTLELTASKKPYDTFTTEKDGEVWVYREKELELRKKDSGRWTLEPGKKSSRTVVVENTGQVNIEDIQLSVAGTRNINQDYVSLATATLGSLSPGESKEAEVVFDLPDTCPGSGCPELSSSIDLRVTGSHGTAATLNLGPKVSTGSETGEDSTTSEKTSEQKNRSDNGMSFSTPEIPGAKATGQFLAAQSTVNIALGLMFIFLMVLAGALKNKDDDDRTVRRNVVRGSNGGGSRPGVQPPRVSPAHHDSDSAPLDGPKTVETGGEETETGEVEEEEDEDEQAAGEETGGEASGKGKVDKLAESLTGEADEEQEEDGENGESSSGGGEVSVECDICGEEFDTEAGVKIHKQTAH